MLSQFQASYQRMEQSLQRLSESIAAYNPSPSAADELVEADAAVNENLEQLVIHQSNYQRLQELRRTAESLDETIKQTVQLLGDTRKEIKAIPSSTTTDEPRREVNVDELLSYAKFISKTTVPPTIKKQDIQASNIKSETQIANGIATPPSGAQGPNPAYESGADNVDMKGMDESARTVIGIGFDPWPSHEVMARGALGNIQRMIESGQDPESVLTAEEQLEAAKHRQEEEERDKLAQEDAERRRMSMFDTGALRRRPTQSDVFNPDDL